MITAHQGDPYILECSDNNVLKILLGPHNANLSLLSQLLKVQLTHKGNLIYIDSSASTGIAARLFLILKSLAKQLTHGGKADQEDILSLYRLTTPASETPAPLPKLKKDKKAAIRQEDNISTVEGLHLRKASIVSRSSTQQSYLKALRENDVIFALGPAGVGKTFLAVAHAVSRLQQGLIKKIILTRPAVEAGENLGFLPGDIQEKLDPYLRPLFDALEEFISHDELSRKLESNIIEIAPLGYMRGRTLKQACIILDEAQNVTEAQLRMFLTRMGADSQIIIAGDPSQVDLPNKNKSGLDDGAKRLAHIDRVAICHFSNKDSMRHPVVEEILNAYGDSI